MLTSFIETSAMTKLVSADVFAEVSPALSDMPVSSFYCNEKD
jgi:hypothetical protein